METWRHVRAIAVLPFMVVVIIPSVLICVTGRTCPGWSLPEPLNLVPMAAGIGVVCLGLGLIVRTIALFATVGQGTLAPWDPPQELVVRCVYRHVRNPMISGVCCILLGEAVVFGSVALGGWSLLFLVGNMVYIPQMEEPDLERRFGERYALYKEAVPKWIPRIRAWQVPWDDG